MFGPNKPPRNADSTKQLRATRSARSSPSLSLAGRKDGNQKPPESTYSARAAFAELMRQHPSLVELNDALCILAEIFPDVRPEVFREMLTTLSDESRLEVVAEQLVVARAKWVNGRWRIPSKDGSANVLKETYGVAEKEPDEGGDGSGRELVPLEETFRTESYKRAARNALYQEFKVLSKSAVDAVLAEQNYYYTLSRPVLLGLAAKSWRVSFVTFWTRWKKTTSEGTSAHFMIQWSKPSHSSPFGVPTLKETGDPDLDNELRQTILGPLLEKELANQESINVELATLLNEQEAEQANALYECECCLSDTTFESMAVCTSGRHTVCFSCIRRAVSEALYGQSWGLTVDHSRGQLSCLAPSSTPCDGCVPRHLSQRAVMSERAGGKTWQMFESRLADEALMKSQLEVVRCPFCAYAEASDYFLPPDRERWRLNYSSPLRTVVLMLLTVLSLPLLCLYALASHIFPLARPASLLSTAKSALRRQTHLPQKFACRSPTCKRTSCLTCHKSWTDIHVCYESATLSLRTTIEAARTAALKRTCPRCGLGFVKDSGCNKMVCMCGYSMCYVCREGLGKRREAGAAEEEQAEGEGYRHFCQHFRPLGGKCGECDKCDLYRNEDEDEIVRRAGQRAERDWREREKLGRDVVGLGSMEERVHWRRYTPQELVDWWVRMVLKC